jgi:hypothetical protein
MRLEGHASDLQTLSKISGARSQNRALVGLSGSGAGMDPCMQISVGRLLQ